MKSTFLKVIKNHNRIYSLMLFWTLWMFVIVNHFKGSIVALILFLIGFCIGIFEVISITDKPNNKERKLIAKIYRF